MESLIQKAADFAAGAHRGQLRKYTGDEYIVHPEAVAGTLETLGFPETVVAAAWLHDVVEDCGITYQTLVEEFGKEVADLVLEVTDMSTKADGNRDVRKEIDRQHLAKASPHGQSIKLADIIDNTYSIEAHDPDFARVYKHEKVRLLEVLTKGHPELLRRAQSQVVTAA